MAQLDSTLIVLILFTGLGIISQNNTVTYAFLILILLKITPLRVVFPYLERHGLFLGVLILTVAVMVPIASGKISPSVMFKSFVEWKSILAIAIGILVAWLAGRGVLLMGAQPNLVAGLLVGTILGVAFLRGVPVGPLIAAGLLSLFVGKGG